MPTTIKKISGGTLGFLKDAESKLTTQANNKSGLGAEIANLPIGHPARVAAENLNRQKTIQLHDVQINTGNAGTNAAKQPTKQAGTVQRRDDRLIVEQRERYDAALKQMPGVIDQVVRAAVLVSRNPRFGRRNNATAMRLERIMAVALKVVRESRLEEIQQQG